MPYRNDRTFKARNFRDVLPDLEAIYAYCRKSQSKRHISWAKDTRPKYVTAAIKKKILVYAILTYKSTSITQPEDEEDDEDDKDYISKNKDKDKDIDIDNVDKDNIHPEAGIKDVTIPKDSKFEISKDYKIILPKEKQKNTQVYVMAEEDIKLLFREGIPPIALDYFTTSMNIQYGEKETLRNFRVFHTETSVHMGPHKVVDDKLAVTGPVKTTTFHRTSPIWNVIPAKCLVKGSKLGTVVIYGNRAKPSQTGHQDITVPFRVVYIIDQLRNDGRPLCSPVTRNPMLFYNQTRSDGATIVLEVGYSEALTRPSG